YGESRVVNLTFDAKITDEITSGAPKNTAIFGWNMYQEGDTSTRKTVDDDAAVTILNPVLELVKKTSHAGEEDWQDAITLNPDGSFDYRISVRNTGDTPAHNIVVEDAIPAGVIVDPNTISDDGELSNTDTDGQGGTITWEIDGPLPVQGEGDDDVITLTYSGTFISSEGLHGLADDSDGDYAQVNTASVEKFESFEEDGWTYTPGDKNPDGSNVPSMEDDAQVTPVFPFIELNKSVTDGDQAAVGEPFSWTLALTNTGEGDANQVTVTDVLPKNWTYDEGSAKVAIGSGGSQDLTDPSVDGADDTQTLTWTFSDEPALEAGQEMVITFTATPQEGALTDAGAGLHIGHTNTLSATATDTQGHEDPRYVDEDDSADAHIAAADLTITKTGADDPLVAGETSLGWTIEVTNNGPDTAQGPITVTDEITGGLPDGIAIDSVGGDGWECSLDSGGEAFECERTNADEPLKVDSSFPVIEVYVSVADDVASGTVVDNTATVVPGPTHDPDEDNNDDDDDITTSTSADLALTKEATTSEPNAGETLTWQITPENRGSSVSWVSDDEPITISDVVPDGMNNVEDPSVPAQGGNPGWLAQADNGFPAEAGDTITWTYIPAEGTEWMPVGPAPTITLSGTIDTDWIGGAEIVNTAEIFPGETPDEDPDNNEDDDTVEPTDHTSINITKNRVVRDGSDWVAPSEDEVTWGEDIHYLITVANNGPADARGVTVTDEIPIGLTYVSVESLDGTWNHSGGTAAGETATFTLESPAPLGVDEAASFVVTLGTDSDVEPGTDVHNVAVASADNADDDDDDDKSGSIWRADLGIEKSHDGDHVVAGESIDYTLVVTNHGPSSSEGPIEVNDRLPDGFTYKDGTAQVNVAGAGVTSIDTDVSDGGRTLTWEPVADGESLAQGATVVITFTADVDSDLPAQEGAVNHAKVDGPNDEDPSNNEDDDPVDVRTHADMTITKDVESSPWVAGTDITYTVTITNDGPSAADNVAIKDVAQNPELTLTGIEATGGHTSGWECDDVDDPTSDAGCEFDGRYATGASTTFTVRATIAHNTDPGEDLDNVATLEWSDSRGEHEGEDNAVVDVTTLADVIAKKTALTVDGEETDSFTPGEMARYLVTVTNDGPSTAAAPITVTDTLPSGVGFERVMTDSSGPAWQAVDNQDGTVTFTVDDRGIAPGAALDLEYEVYVDASVGDDE
ncbi:MAG TPA: isopeptide-forming domain-containing fimbrial protein, partial [Beutenbergiaceae bacterium]|nr:isopeptide-forming domain-containing fimbrial protein [Beutenbergiaceae bacterium]